MVNRCVEQYLRCFVNQRPKQWSAYLPWAEYWYNTAYHSSTGMTPFQALYGRLPPSIPKYYNGSSPVDELDHKLKGRDEVLNQLKQNLSAAVNRMKQVADRKRRDVTFNEGDYVFLKLQPYRQHSAYRRAHQKLASRYYGPFQVLERVGQVAYKLQLPEGTRVHPVFHVSLLKRVVGDGATVSKELPPFNEDGAVDLEPDAIVDTRWVKKGPRFVEESLVTWKQLPKEDATWEDTTLLKELFPGKDLEDKVHFQGRDNDKLRKSMRVPIKNSKYFQ